MLNRLMITAATAALIAGTGFANAQGSMGREAAPSSGAGTQQSAPSSATPGHEGSEPGQRSGQSEQKGTTPNQRAQQEPKPGAMGAPNKNMSSENEKGGGKDMKAEGREGRENKAEGRDERGNTAPGTKEEGRSKTVGQAGAGGKMTTEQRTRITTVIRGQHVAPVTNINFSISVGTRVPPDVGFHPLPTEIVTLYPDWRGYEFILVRDQIVVVDPRTFEIVAVIDA